MTTDPARTELKVQNDPRLLIAVGAIVSHSAHRAGLPREAQQAFAEAAVDACRETFPLLGNDGSDNRDLRMVVEDFPDRVQVTIEHSGEATPTAGLDSFVGGLKEGVAAGISHSLQDTRVDRVQYDTHEGRSRMTLIKYRDGRKANA
ncbi:MAG: hypothetical protein WB987_00595 [Candidatus Acidiferrales bacterium]